MLKGKVVAKDNPKAGIPFATVYLPQTGGGTVTRADGSFEIRNLSPDTYRLEISSLGYQTLQTSVKLDGKTPQDLSFGLQEANFRLTEVVVTATGSKAGATTSSKISRMAMDHMQAVSLIDVMQLLPGATSAQPDLINVSTFGLRGGSSFGTAVIMDGAPLSNNSNMQMMSTSIGASLPGTRGLSPRTGIDLRTITTDNIESVEVLTGVPGVEYGDLTSGAIIVNTKAGRQPLQIKFNTNPNVYMFSGTKGFGLGGKAGNLNLGLDYAYSNSDPTEGYDYYQRITARMMYSNVFFRNRLRSNTSLNLMYGKDKGEPNPDDEQDVSNTRQKDIGVVFNTNGILEIDRGWFRNIRYTASLNYTRRHSFYQNEALNADVGYSQSMTDSSILSRFPGRPILDEAGNDLTHVPEGEEDTKAWLLPNNYFFEYNLYGKEFNTFARLSANFAGKTGRIYHRMVIGADYRNSGNLGRGKVFDPENPPARNVSYNFATQRERAFKDVPFMNHLGIYAEEKLQWMLGKHEFNLSAGVRWDKICGFRDGFSPRINASIDLLPQRLALRGAYGIALKSPSVLYLHPEKAYFDMVNFSNASSSKFTDDQKFQLITTRIFDTENPDLEMAKNRKAEIGLDFRYRKMRFLVTAYQEKCDNGYSIGKSVNTFKSVPYIQYQAVKPYPEEGTELPRLEVKAENPYLLSYTTPMNSAKYLVRGIDFDLDFGRIDAIRTAFNLNGAYRWRRSGSANYMFWNNEKGTDYSKFPPMGVFDPDHERDYSEQMSTNLRIIHNIPQLGLVATLTGNVIWKDRSWTRYGNDTIPVRYISRVDGRLHDFNPADIDNEEFAGIDRRGEVSQTRFRREGNMPPLLTVHLNITKEIRDFLKVSFFANNMFRNNPLWESKKNPGSYIRRNVHENTFFFGLELSAIIR